MLIVYRPRVIYEQFILLVCDVRTDYHNFLLLESLLERVSSILLGRKSSKKIILTHCSYSPVMFFFKPGTFFVKSIIFVNSCPCDTLHDSKEEYQGRSSAGPESTGFQQVTVGKFPPFYRPSPSAPLLRRQGSHLVPP